MQLGELPGLTLQRGTVERQTPQPGQLHRPSPTTIVPIREEPVLEASGVHATTPPITDPQTTMQRADEINTIQRMFSSTYTSTVIVTGSPGAGKSTLAALLYRRLQLAKQSGLPAPRYMVWLTISNYTTIPDIISTILTGVGMKDPGLFLLKPDQQISALLRALRRPQDNALIVLDQFELLLHPETNQGVAGRGVLPLFLEMLQTDLGSSRILLTSYSSPFDENQENSRVRTYLVSRISLPEGVALLQQHGAQGTPEDLSFVWQRCSGHVFSLVLFSILNRLSGLDLSYLLNAPEYRPLWAGDVVANLIVGVFHFLNPTQNAIVHALSLFHEPASKEGVIMTITSSTIAALHQSGNVEAVTTLEHELEQLTKLGLVQPMHNIAGLPSYTLHPLLRQYILEHFMEDKSDDVNEGRAPEWTTNPQEITIDRTEDRQAACANGHVQVAAYYKHVISTQCPPRGQRKGPQDVEPIIAAIRHFCLGWHWQRACELLFAEHLHEDMLQWGAWSTLIGLYTAMLPPFGVLLRRDEGMITSHVGMLYGRIGEHQQSKGYFDQALLIQRQINDQHGEATTLANMGEMQRLRGELQSARQCFECALELSNFFSDHSLRCVVQHNLGLLSHQERHYSQAEQYYAEAIKLAYTLQKEQYQGMILTNLGMLLYEQHQQLEALAILMVALELRQRTQDPSAPLLERFLVAIEQKMGSKQYARAIREASELQPRVFARFMPANMRQ